MHLFSATLRDNLLLASPGSSDEALAEILRRVGLEKLLEDAGLNSWLGEGGRQLSGGELRRLAIAVRCYMMRRWYCWMNLQKA